MQKSLAWRFDVAIAAMLAGALSCMSQASSSAYAFDVADAPLIASSSPPFAGMRSVYVEPLESWRVEPTAVYDIAAHVVVMPDGVRLEAHSGLGERADNPRFVNERMSGSTPPAIYELLPLKALFHGVAALRLRPISSKVFGRTDLLAHTYMLRGRPESYGCVVFRDYAAFLRAFRMGGVKRLRVVPAIGDASLRLA